MYPDKFISSIQDVPNEEHYVVLEGKSTYVPGDERSRTNPGHGYPAETIHSLSYNLVSESRLQAYIESLIQQKKVPNVDFKVIKATPVEVKTVVTVICKT